MLAEEQGAYERAPYRWAAEQSPPKYMRREFNRTVLQRLLNYTVDFPLDSAVLAAYAQALTIDGLQPTAAKTAMAVVQERDPWHYGPGRVAVVAAEVSTEATIGG